MSERVVRLRTHEKNIGRYEALLKTNLTDAEREFVERRLSEERLTLAMLQFMSPSVPKALRPDLPSPPE